MNPRPPERKSSGFDTLGSEDAPTGSGFEPLTSAVVVAAPDASFVTNERICFSQDSNSSEASRVKNRKRVISKKKEKNSTVQISSWSFFLSYPLSFSLSHSHTHSPSLSPTHTQSLFLVCINLKAIKWKKHKTRVNSHLFKNTLSIKSGLQSQF